MFSLATLRCTLRQVLLALTCLLASTIPTMAQGQHQHATPPGTTAENYGRVHFPISCSPQAQERFVSGRSPFNMLLLSWTRPVIPRRFRASGRSTS